MKKIKIKFEINSELKEHIIQQLETEFFFEETNTPDFVMFEASTMQKCFKYKCVRILYIGENLRPDFNLFDYAIGFDDIQFGDRYLQRPNYLGPHFIKCFNKAMKKNEYSDEVYLSKRKFCNFVVSNGKDAYPIRTEMFDKLCCYKKVDSSGKYRNNMNGYIVPLGYLDEFRKDYKFSLAFENSSMIGYTTEKIIRAWSGLTIPIYWGDPEIEKYFNRKAFINVMSYSSMEEVIKRIIEVDQNDELYLEIMKEPIIIEGSKVWQMKEEKYLLDFLRNIFGQTPHEALRRTNIEFGWGYHYENRMRIQHEMEQNMLTKLTYKFSKVGRFVKKQSK